MELSQWQIFNHSAGIYISLDKHCILSPKTSIDGTGNERLVQYLEHTVVFAKVASAVI